MKLPVVNARQCIAALQKIGFYIVRRSKGTHIYLQRDNPAAHISVPDHAPIKPGTLRAIHRFIVDSGKALLHPELGSQHAIL